MLFLLSSSSSSLLLLLSSSSFYYYYYYYYYYHYYYCYCYYYYYYYYHYHYHYYYYYYYYYYCHYSVNNIPYQCDKTCAGHFTLDALASRTVACFTKWQCHSEPGQWAGIALDPCLIYDTACFVRRRNGGRQRNQPSSDEGMAAGSGTSLWTGIAFIWWRSPNEGLSSPSEVARK